MSTDEKVARQLAKTLANGREGYEQAAEKVGAAGHAEVVTRFRQFAVQRAEMGAELETIAAAYGDDVEARSTLPGAVHRGWMALKDALTRDDLAAVVRTAEQGEDHALKEYREAIESDISPEFRTLLQRQMTAVESAHDYVKTLDLATK